MSAKRILLIYAKNSLELLNRQSALGSYLYVLCGILEKGGYRVQVNDILFGDLKKQEQTTNVINPSGSANSLFKFVPGILKNFIKDISHFKSIKNKYSQIAITKEFDLILEFYTYGSNIGYLLSKKKKKPLIVVYDAPVLEEYEFFHGKNYFFRNKILKRQYQTIKQASWIVTYSASVKKHLEKLVNAPIKNSIHQNVDFTRFEFIENKQFDRMPVNIGFIGSFLKWHKVDFLLDAFNKLREEGINARLFLIGNGMEYSSIKNQAEVSKYAADIIMPGFTDGEKLLDYKKMIHIGVMPGSNWYGAPNKIFEYGAANMAVIAPATPTIAELFLNNTDLLLFDENSFADFYLHLKVLCTNPKLCKKLSQQLHTKITSTYSEASTFNYYNSIFTQLKSE